MRWARVRDFGELQKKTRMSPIRAARKARTLEVILSRYLRPKTIERFGLANPYCSVDAKKVLLNMIRRNT